MNEQEATDWKIPLNRAVCMQHLLMLVGLGYHCWHSGLVSCDRLIPLIAKLGTRFPIADTPGQRAWAKKQGDSNVQLVVYSTNEKRGYCRWWLLATPSRSTDAEPPPSIYRLEPMKSALAEQTPLTYGAHFILVRRTREVYAAESGTCRSQQLRWTWELSPTTYREWGARLEETAKHAPDKLFAEFGTLRTNPGFTGINAQMHELERAAAAAWQKRRRQPYKSWLPRRLPTFIGTAKVFGSLTAGTLVTAWRDSLLGDALIARREAFDVLSSRDGDRRLTSILIERSSANDAE